MDIEEYATTFARVFPPPQRRLNLAVGFNPLVSTQIMFNRIPPAGAGGSFNPSLQGLEGFPRIPPPAGGGSFKSNLLAQQRKTEVGIERSTTCRWWDSGGFLGVL